MFQINKTNTKSLIFISIKKIFRVFISVMPGNRAQQLLWTMTKEARREKERVSELEAFSVQ